MLPMRRVPAFIGSCTRMALLLVAVAPAPARASQAPPLRALLTADRVHGLTYAESLGEYPVHLLGEQVLYYDQKLGLLFIHDSSGGVYVDMREQAALPLHPGDIIDVDGVSSPGGYAPIVGRPRIRLMGSRPLPLPRRSSLDHLLTGVEDCRWVEVEGVVRSVQETQRITSYADQAASGGGTILVTLATGIGRLDVIVEDASGFDHADLIDANVIVRGVSGPRFNQSRQLIGVHLFSQGLAQFQVVQRGVIDPFSLPIHAISSVMNYEAGATPEHRIRVRGIVTANRDGRFLSISDGKHGLFVRTSATRDLNVGDVVEVVGFPTMGEYTPVLEDVVYRKIGTGTLPAPTVVTTAELFKGGADAELVRVRGRLLKHTRTLRDHNLLISADDRTFAAVLLAGPGADPLADLREGSILEVTGTCLVEVFPDDTPRAVQILLRSRQDVLVVSAASWWTAQRTMAAIGVLLLVVMGAVGWITRLRYRVRAQMAALRKAREESAAIADLANAMQEVAMHRKLSPRVSAAGSEQIAQLGIGFNKMLTELEEGALATRQAEAKLQQQALTDELTGLPNRRLLSDRLAQSLALAEREQRLLALLYIDLDGFKAVNDSLGHKIGDLLLVEVAGRLHTRIRHADTLARIGGDEFTVILTTLRSAAEAEVVAASLLRSLSQPFLIEGYEMSIGASVGISLFPRDATDPMALLQQADSAMYAAKTSGKNQVQCFNPELGSSLRERLSLESQLHGAVSRGEIHLHYQPEFDLSSYRLVRFEALARWTHPTLGTIPPAKFIPLAEESGQIAALGAYLFECACTEAVRWQKPAAQSIQVAVNVSSIQFARSTFVEEVAQILKRTGLRAELLQIELTESIMLNGAERAAETMRGLHALGVSLAIDDFGTGYSCLSYLPSLPFDTLKIDRSFVGGLESREGSKAVVRLLIELAHSLRMWVVVEGIETTSQLELIRRLGADEVQGFLLGRPTPNPADQLHSYSETLNLSPDAVPSSSVS